MERFTTAVQIQHLPVDELYEREIYPLMQDYVGYQYRVVHLKSQKGKTLNGKTCWVVGYDRNEEARLHCQIDGIPRPMALKYQNLIPLETNQPIEEFMPWSKPISNSLLASCLENAIKKNNGYTDRQDLTHRLSLYKRLLKKIQNGTVQDADYCLPCGAGIELLEGNYAILMQKSKPACYGNEICDIRLMDLGLKGDGSAECSICQEVLNDDPNLVVATLPCLHVFHQNCILHWLGSPLGQENWNCPSCRKTVPREVSLYLIEYQEQLQRRIDEYPLSGYCTKCMIMVMENNREQELPISVCGQPKMSFMRYWI